jgi:hypothetical protein
MQRTFAWIVIAMVAAALMVSCGGDSGTETPTGPPAPVTSRTGTGELPPDHPPLGEQPQGTVPPPPPGSGTGASGMTWTVPSGWVEEQPTNSMRRAQYRVPGAAGDGECVVFYFGPNQGGGPMDNANRWASQFRQLDGRPSTEVLKTSQIDVGGLPVLLVELTGTYVNLMVNDEEMPGHMLLGAIAPGPDANWFFKFTGPEATVREQRDAFNGMVQSIRSGGS